MHRLRWKFNRLCAMQWEEITWRMRQAMRVQLERAGVGMAYRPPPVATEVPLAPAAFGKPWIAAIPMLEDGRTTLRAADAILAGCFDVFALRGTALGFPPRWNRDPKTGITAPLVFGKSLDYRDARLVGDIKYLWEPNRHQELVTLAQAWHLSRDPRYARGCRRLLESWFVQCPYPRGQGWSSALENAIRLTNWAVAWHLLGGPDSAVFGEGGGEAFRWQWLDVIYQHCHFIAGHFSQHSSANNHLLGEYMGLYVGATTWACWSESPGWRETARAGLEAEALRQNSPDGVNREQAIWYQHEVADMLLLCGLFARENGTGFSDGYWQRLEAMLAFLASLMDAGGHVPMIGDADDAVMVRWSVQPSFDPYRSLLASGAVLFGRTDFHEKAGGFDDRNRWLMGDRGAAIFTSMTQRRVDAAPGPPRTAFPEGGYHVLGDAFDTPHEIRIIADAGPLGYLAIAAHGHADALSFTLSAAGMPILIDPGTFAYHTEPKWRRYFRGTSAHNTVRIDRQDQSIQGGNFLWLRKADARCDQWESTAERDCWGGHHEGYVRLADPVRHHRHLRFDKRTRILEVEDVLECSDGHLVEWHWHFSDRCSVAVTASGAEARCGEVLLEMSMPAVDGILTLATGQEDPPLGWISPRFDEKGPSPTLVWTERIHGTVHRTTVLRLSIGNSPSGTHLGIT